MKTRLDKNQIMRVIGAAGREASFVGNVILCWQRRPWMKLRGLAQLILNGSSVRTGSYDLDILLVDGCRMEWEALEKVAQ